MATFRQRGSSWEYRISYSDPITGKRKEKSKSGFKTKKEAKIAADDVEVEINHGYIKNEQSTTISIYLDIWFDTYKDTVKNTSLRNRVSSINVIKKHIGDVLLIKINYSFYQKFLNKLSKEYAKNTLTSIHQVMSMMIKSAVRDSYFKFNPIADCKIPRYDNEKEKIKFLENDELELFLSYCKTDITKKRAKDFSHIVYDKERDYALILLMVYGGLRIGEMTALKIEDYNKFSKEIDVNKTYATTSIVNNKNAFEIVPPKTKSSYRKIPLPEIAWKQLEKWILLRKSFKLMYINQFDEQQFLFPETTGAPLPLRNTRYKVTNITKKSGIDKHITPHDLRHTYTSLLIQADIPIKEIQSLLGHSSIKTTLDVYAHVTKEKKAESIDKFNNLVNKIG